MVQADTKNRILTAAEKLFAEKGFHGTGMSDIERAVGVGRGALYYHIGSKESLLFEITIARIDALNNAAEEVLARDTCPEEKFRLLARSVVEDIAEHENATRIFYHEWQWLEGKNRRKMLRAADKFEQAWARLLDEGIASGVFQRRTKITLKAIIGLLNSTYLWFDPNGPLEPAEVADEFVDILLRGISK